MILGYFALTKMKPVCLLYFSPLLLLGLANSCCVESSSGLKRKWELWTRPFLRKRAVEIAQERLLSILGLENFPTPARHVIPHKFMLELYRNLSSGTYKGNLNYDMVPSAVVGIVDQGQCVLLSGGFCKCLSLFCICFTILPIWCLVSCSSFSSERCKVASCFLFVFYLQNAATIQ